MSFLGGTLSQGGETLAPVNLATTMPEVARHLAELLGGAGSAITDGDGSELVWNQEPDPQPLVCGSGAVEVWAVDGGQALVADARCLSVAVTRSATVCFRAGRCDVEEVGALRAHLLGAGHGALGLPALGLELDERTPVDINLLRDWVEWQAAAAVLDRAQPGALLLIDGDLVADWRSPTSMVTDLLGRARERGVGVAGVTKHSSLARGGAPLVGQLEREAAESLGRCRWWTEVGRTRPGSHWPDLMVLVARLDPDARYAFRIDLPAGTDPERVLGQLAAVSNDAAFPGYPYPLSVADRLASCPAWIRADAWLALDEALEQAGVPAEVRERAFDDRHRLMERA